MSERMDEENKQIGRALAMAMECVHEGGASRTRTIASGFVAAMKRWEAVEEQWKLDIAERDQLKKDLEAARADIEVYTQYAEKCGDLSCCYDAEDVVAVIDSRRAQEREEWIQSGLTVQKQLAAERDSAIAERDAAREKIKGARESYSAFKRRSRERAEWERTALKELDGEK